ncbi:MAG: cryptochrome/photolyase family protein [Myxococcota bacterium]
MSRGIHWFRNDLRLSDNGALRLLLSRVDQWLPVFVLDRRLLGPPPRTRFWLETLDRLSAELGERDVPLLIREGRPEDVLPKLLHETSAEYVSWGESATPFGRRRDDAVRSAVEKAGARVLSCRDDVVFGADEVLTQEGRPYAVYTPYKNAWWRRFREEPRRPQRLPRVPPAIPRFRADAVPEPPDADVDLPTAGSPAAKRRLRSFLSNGAARYHEDRDRPALDGTSRLSPYLRCGAISVRQCVAAAEEARADEPGLGRGVEKWLDELVWREFYAAVLEAHPRVLHESYRSEYDDLVWNDDADGFAAWCEGRTGYPIVDAGMRQLRQTGWMHNRVRMIVASFLTKDLLIDWREGERFFHEWLVDGDPASNNGGWQWAASTGTDPQPFFRIFNPVSQGRRWDPEGDYVRRFVPELSDVPDRHVHSPWEAGLLFSDYPPPIVDHAERREEALARFEAVRG